jgi:hypothetical protein
LGEAVKNRSVDGQKKEETRRGGWRKTAHFKGTFLFVIIRLLTNVIAELWNYRQRTVIAEVTSTRLLRT